MFAHLNGATIKNLFIDYSYHPDILNEASTSSASDSLSLFGGEENRMETMGSNIDPMDYFVGGLSAYAINSRIEQVNISSFIHLRTQNFKYSDMIKGGILGYAENTTIINSTASSYRGNWEMNRGGAIVGKANSIILEGCQGSGTITFSSGNSHQQGLIGDAQGSTKIINSVVKMTVDEYARYRDGMPIINPWNADPFIAYPALSGEIQVINSYSLSTHNLYDRISTPTGYYQEYVGTQATPMPSWNTDMYQNSYYLNDIYTSFGGRTREQFKQQATFVDWDFENVWGIEEGKGYPRLRWEDSESTFYSLEEIYELATYYLGTSDDGMSIRYTTEKLHDENGVLLAYAVPYVDESGIHDGHLNIGARKNGILLYLQDPAPENFEAIRDHNSRGENVKYQTPFIYYIVPSDAKFNAFNADERVLETDELVKSVPDHLFNETNRKDNEELLAYIQANKTDHVISSF